MQECDFCGEEFESERALHIHWGEEHEDELNSHQEESVKKANREQEEEKKESRKRKKDLAFKGLISVLILGVAALVIPQMLSTSEADQSQGLENINLTDRPVKGNIDANVTVIEFGDYYCPACKAFTQTVMPQLQQNYIEPGKIKFYYMDFPLEIHNPQATMASVAAQCVYKQDSEQFWKYHDALYQQQKNIQYNAEGLTSLARDSTSGIDYDRLQSCISSRETMNKVQEDKNLALDNNVRSTPTIFVNGEKVQNDYRSLKNAIDNSLSN